MLLWFLGDASFILKSEFQHTHTHTHHLQKISETHVFFHDIPLQRPWMTKSSNIYILRINDKDSCNLILLAIVLFFISKLPLIQVIPRQFQHMGQLHHNNGIFKFHTSVWKAQSSQSISTSYCFSFDPSSIDFYWFWIFVILVVHKCCTISSIVILQHYLYKYNIYKFNCTTYLFHSITYNTYIHFNPTTKMSRKFLPRIWRSTS